MNVSSVIPTPRNVFPQTMGVKSMKMIDQGICKFQYYFIGDMSPLAQDVSDHEGGDQNLPDDMSELNTKVILCKKKHFLRIWLNVLVLSSSVTVFHKRYLLSVFYAGVKVLCQIYFEIPNLGAS